MSLALVKAGIRGPHAGPASGTGNGAKIVASTERGAITNMPAQYRRWAR